MIAWQCKTWDSLPYAGGIFDQPVKLMLRMQATLNAYNSVKEFIDVGLSRGGWDSIDPKRIEFASALLSSFDKHNRGE